MPGEKVSELKKFRKIFRKIGPLIPHPTSLLRGLSRGATRWGSWKFEVKRVALLDIGDIGVKFQGLLMEDV